MKTFYCGLTILISYQCLSVASDQGSHVYEPPITEAVKTIREEAMENREENLNSYKNAVNNSTRDIVFKGKVVTTSGDPVPEAVVRLSVQTYDPSAELFIGSQTYELKTDPNGLFCYKGRGISVGMEDIIKEGYEYKYDYLDYRYFNYINKYKEGPAASNPTPFNVEDTKPIVFRVRKFGIYDYLVTDSFVWYFKKSKNEAYQPLLLGEWNDYYGQEMNLYARQEPRNKCLEISCIFNEDYSEFRLTFRSLYENSGVLLSDELMYEAPLSGYEQEVIYTNTMVRVNSDGGTPGWHRVEKYIYVKGPDESYYSRIHLAISTLPPGRINIEPHVQVIGEIFTNPQGRRYLEYNEEYNQNERVIRKIIQKEKSKQRIESSNEKKPYDEKAFKQHVDKKRSEGYYKSIIEKKI